MGFGKNKHVVDIWYTKIFLTVLNDTRNDDSNVSTILGIMQYAKKEKCSFFCPLQIVTISNFYSGARTLGSRLQTQEAVTVYGDIWMADYTA